MADVILPVTQGIKTGVLDVVNHVNSRAGTAAGAGFFLMPNDGMTVLVCVCGVTPRAINFIPVPDRFGRVETLNPTPTASGTSIFGPFLPEIWNNHLGQIRFQAAAGGLATDRYLAVRISDPR
ncbi:MAG: hypothetical protein DDT23_00012 [candidate division WS2 bacterium]|nr:hypothetical protein [Candidatus Lithacetigena glycinireducens]